MLKWILLFHFSPLGPIRRKIMWFKFSDSPCLQQGIPIKSIHPEADTACIFAGRISFGRMHLSLGRKQIIFWAAAFFHLGDKSCPNVDFIKTYTIPRVTLHQLSIGIM